MSDTSASASRRTLLAAAVAAASGCTQYVPRGDIDCTYGPTAEFETSAVELFAISITDQNSGAGGSCSRWSSHLCLHTTLELDPAVVDRVEGRTSEGGVVVETSVGSDGTVHRLQLAEFERDGSVEREIVLLDADGAVVDRAGAYARCG